MVFLQKTYDGLSDSSMLQLTWISKSSAEQRKGRAGRTGPGVCYKLYSSARAAAFCQRTVPEILRIPLADLCLATKVIAPTRQPIAEFLVRQTRLQLGTKKAIKCSNYFQVLKD